LVKRSFVYLNGALRGFFRTNRLHRRLNHLL
jgi:hypothetical protein